MMWMQPWKLKEGFAIGLGLVLTGLMLQWSVGHVQWKLFAFPLNLLALVFLLLIIGVVYALRSKVYAFRFLSTYAAAVPALCWAVFLTAIMGITRQVPTGHAPVDVLGFTDMLSSWPFVLVYFWLVIQLGELIVDRLFRFTWRDIPFYLNHLGLFIVMVSATLGSADMQRLKLNINMETPEWRAVDDQGKVHELALAIQLKRFRIDEYPPKLMLINTKTGREIPERKSYTLLVDSTFKGGDILKWHFRILKRIKWAAPVMTRDTTNYVSWPSSGASCALLVRATKRQTDSKGHAQTLLRQGWVTCGSYLFPYQELKLDDKVTLVMPEREPERFISRVEILTKSGKRIMTDILVNQPFELEGWKIYQLDYNRQMGCWSDTSVLELVSDPWLPLVYTGIYMMLAGALCMFIIAQKKRGTEK